MREPQPPSPATEVTVAAADDGHTTRDEMREAWNQREEGNPFDAFMSSVFFDQELHFIFPLSLYPSVVVLV